MRRIVLTALLAPVLTAATGPAASLEVAVEKLRSPRGLVHACVTRSLTHFPDCRRDPEALKQTVSAQDTPLRFVGLSPGRYALTLFHDENANVKLDTLLGVPREGFGFSRNPVVRFGAPRFDSVVIEIRPGITRASVRMQYIL